jgi:hypothetical protein
MGVHGDAVLLPSSGIVDERGTEARDTRPSRVTDARIDDTIRAAVQKCFGECLTRSVELLHRTRFEARLALLLIEVAEHAGKVGEKVLIVKSQRLCDTCVNEEASLVETYLGHRRLQFHPGVPCTALRIVEAGAERTRVAEGRVDDVGFRYAEQQLSLTEQRVAPQLRDLPLVGHGVEFAEVGKDFFRQWKCLQDAAAFRGVLSGDETVRAVVLKGRSCFSRFVMYSRLSEFSGIAFALLISTYFVVKAVTRLRQPINRDTKPPSFHPAMLPLVHRH